MRMLLLLVLLAGLVGLPACGDTPTSNDPDAGSARGASTSGASESGASKSGMPQGEADPVLACMARGHEFLLGQINADGSIGKGPEAFRPAMTAMAVLGLIAATPREEVRQDPKIIAAIEYLLSFQDPGGAIVEKTGKRNYLTSVFVSALAMARVPAYRDALVRAKDYIEGSQIAGAESDLSYGGFPYKQEQGQPADLSNAQFALEALKNAEREGEKVDPVVWERARKLLARLQNRSEVNTGTYHVTLPGKDGAEGKQIEVVSGNDNGATYYPGSSKAGYDKRADGTYVARSYGSMTYALLKCLLFSGVKPEDPRVVGAVRWISEHWSVAYNPGAASEQDRMQGYYYYLFTASRALAEYERHAKQKLVVRDANGETHDWRAELAEQIVSLQQPDGFWVNEADRFEEGSPAIVTSYALQALAFIRGRLP